MAKGQGVAWGCWYTELDFGRHSIRTDGPAEFRIMPSGGRRGSKGKRKRVEVRAPKTTKIEKVAV